MYIEKYWGEYIGGSDDSLNLVAFLEDQKKEEIPLNEIFDKIGLNKLNWNFRQTVEYLGFTHSNGVETDFHFAIDVITDLAAILLECIASGGINLHDLDEYDTPSRYIRIIVTPEEYNALDKVLSDFVQNPLEYDLSDLIGEDEIKDMAVEVDALRKELYELSKATEATIIQSDKEQYFAYEEIDKGTAKGQLNMDMFFRGCITIRGTAYFKPYRSISLTELF